MRRQLTGIICGASLLLLAGCGGGETGPTESSGASGQADSAATPGPAQPASSGPAANIEEMKKTMDENPGLDWNTASNMWIEKKLGWDQLPEGPKSTDLPGDLDGILFLGDDGSEVKCFASGKATIQTPSDPAPIDATYTVGAPGSRDALTLSNVDNGKECKVSYAAQVIGKKVMINVQVSTLPKLPSVLKGTLKG